MSQPNSPHLSVSFTPPLPCSRLTWSVPVLPPPTAPSPPAPAQPAMAAPRLNPVLEAVISVTAIVIGMTAISGAAYVAGGFVLAQLAAQAQAYPPPRAEPKPQNAAFNDRAALSTATPQTQDPLADAAAIMQLDRAARLAAIDNLQAAIASAIAIPASSPSYEQAQTDINQWSEQLLQLAERRYTEHQLETAFEYARAIPPASSAFVNAQQLLQQWQEQQQLEQSNNQQHLQMAQQALEQDDGTAAVQEAGQITDAPGWQVQKATILHKAKPLTRWQTANQFLEQGEPENAINEANRLPIAVPWLERKNLLLEKATEMIADQKADRRRRKLCQSITFGLLSECPS